MNGQSFDEKMASILSRLTEFQQNTQQDSNQALRTEARMLEEFSTALEELHAADQELRERNEELAVASLRYQDLFELAPDAYLSTDLNGKIREGNRAAAALFRVPLKDIAGRLLPGLIADKDRKEFRRLLTRVAGGESVRDRDVLIRQSDDLIPCACSMLPMRDTAGHITGLLWLIRDITERKQAEEAQRIAEERFRVALSDSPVMVFQQDCELRYTWVYHPLLLKPEEIVGKQDADISPVDVAARLTEIKKSVIESGVGRREQVEWKLNGLSGWVDLTVEPYHDKEGKVIGIIGAASDISELKRQQDVLEDANTRLDRAVAERTAALEEANTRLRGLTQMVVSVQEEERRRISRELHDEAGQALTALKMNLEVLQDDAPPDLPQFKARMGEMVDLIVGTLEQIRTLAQDLHPPALEAANINAILEGVCREFSRRSRLEIAYRGVTPPAASEATKVTLYRFLQEALTNVAKHAEASKVQVELHWDAEELTLSVRDDGCGFDAKSNLLTLKPNSLGLVGMQERLKTVGGWLEIDSTRGQGTQLSAQIPYKEAE